MTVQRHRDGDNLIFRWGDVGKSYTFTPGNAEEGLAAYSNAVAEGIARQEVEKMDEMEREVALELQGHIGVRKDAADSLIVAFYPTGDTQEAISKIVPGGVPADQLHLTLLYLGDPDVDGSGPWDVELIAAVVKVFASRGYQCKAEVTGIGRFVGGDDQDVIVALIDSPDLENLRRNLRDELSYACALPYNSQVSEHGFLPHITLAYVPKDQTTPTANNLDGEIEFTIDNIGVQQGDQKAVYTIGSAWSGGEYGGEDAAPSPVYNARAVLEKAGRTLSGKNLSALQAAHQAMGKVIDAELERQAGNQKGGPNATGDNADVAGLSADVGGTATSIDKAADEDALQYIVTKSSDDGMHYTLGPLYAPNRKDAHGEWTDPETLHKALIDFMQERFDAGDNSLNLQHGDLGEVKCGRIVEAMAWPYDHTITLTKAGEEPRTIEMPAGTTYMGVIWSDDAHPLVKSGKLGGLSLGGKAIRVQEGEGLVHMGDKHASRNDPKEN